MGVAGRPWERARSLIGARGERGTQQAGQDSQECVSYLFCQGPESHLLLLLLF